MRYISDTQGRRVLARLAVMGLMSTAIAGCSSDSSRMTSLADLGFTAPAQPAPEVTGSLGAPSGAPAYGAPAYGAPAYGAAAAHAAPPPPTGAPNSYAAGGQPLYGAPNYASAPSAPANYVDPSYTGPVSAPNALPAGRAVAGGSHVVQAGETLTSVARLYNVTPAALGAANGIGAGKTVRTGQTLVIPPANGAVTAQAPAPATPLTTPSGRPATVAAAPAPAPTMAPAKPVPAPTKPVATAAAPVPPAAAAPTAAVARAPAPAPATTTAAAPKVETAAKVSAAPEVEDAPRPAGASGPQFRAPVRGRVISSFGPKPGGARNEGVNFAVPEGTSVRAAEDGVVAYSGNELKGYGNLVLIKHSDGYVTAYAHNSELDVKRGDTVRRGQIIAKAGQSGDVQSPQLHFEIRKGSTAVDPSRYVAGL